MPISLNRMGMSKRNFIKKIQGGNTGGIPICPKDRANKEEILRSIPVCPKNRANKEEICLI